MIASPHPPLPGQPRDHDGPVFAEPWQAQAFAMTLKLHAAGHFTWAEWAQALAAEIAAAHERGEPDLGDTYYEHWLAALEKLVAGKGLVDAGEARQRAAAWAETARHTPLGHPALLSSHTDSDR